MESARSDNDALNPPPAATVLGDNVCEQVGALIGPYKLMELIGEGGFGLVFVAEQLRPVKRKVALKLIKPGMDTREVIARFEAERQALALMDHPNIARVLDAGATDSGRPYFVMELVRGVPITDYCDQNHFPPRERLELFISVCHAVQHAHQKGIIHRDLKPSNVLVTMHDGRPVVKVIDFGVAKALHQQVTEKTVYTRVAQMIGTPLYMSPEQAAMSGLDIDTRSDIYSLGVLLYELLTGTTPFDKKRLGRAAYDELIRIIRDEEPPKPSTRLSHSTDSLVAIAALRRTEPARLSRMFRGDLDWITMKALEKDRTRRYETASGLAEDVECYLRDEPVRAGPPSAQYRLRKLARKYRRGLAVAAAIATLLVAGAAFSTWEAIHARHAEQAALQERDRAVAAEAEAEAARSGEAAQRQNAEAAQRAEVELRKRAQVALDRSEQNLYFNRIAMADRYWQANNPTRAIQVLDTCSEKYRDWEWYYLKGLEHAEVLSCPGTFAAYSPDGQLLATTGADKCLRIRDAQSGKVSLRLLGEDLLSGAVFAPDSRRVASVCNDGTIRIWALPSGRQTLKLPTKASAGSPNRFGLAFSPDGKRIAVGRAKPDLYGTLLPDGLTVWDVVTGKELLTLPRAGMGLAFSPDGKHLATSVRGDESFETLFSTVWILDAETGRKLTRLEARDAIDAPVRYSPDGKWVVFARYEEIKIVDAVSGKEVRTLRGHENSVNSLSFSADAKRLASCSWDGTIRIWDPVRGETMFVNRAPSGVFCVSFRPDGKFVASGGNETVRIWNATCAQGSRLIPGTDSVNSSAAVSPDGKTIACMQARFAWRPLVLVDTATGRQLRRLRNITLLDVPSQVADVLFSSDGRLLAFGLDPEVQVWDVASGEVRARIDAVTGINCRGLAFSPDCRRLAFTAGAKSVEVWDIKDHKRLSTLQEPNTGAFAIAFSSDGQRVVSGCYVDNARVEGRIVVWDAATGRVLCSLAKQHYHRAVAFSPDGKEVVTSAMNQPMRVWDLENGQVAKELRGHRGLVSSLAFNPSGTRVASLDDATLKIWAWPAGEEVLSIPVQKCGLVAFVADGKSIATVGDEGVAFLDALPRPASTVLSE